MIFLYPFILKQYTLSVVTSNQFGFE